MDPLTDITASSASVIPAQTPVPTPVLSDPSVPYTNDKTAANLYYDDVADPEPVSVVTDVDVSAGVYNDVADPEPAGYYTGVAGAPASLSLYDDAVADPEPAAYYDAAADPEPYGYPQAGYSAVYGDASDPEPAPAAPVVTGVYTGAGVAYDGASNSVVSGPDFYDAVADPEPAGYGPGPAYLGAADPEPGADPEYYQY